MASLRERILKLLDTDREFRYAVAVPIKLVVNYGI